MVLTRVPRKGTHSVAECIFRVLGFDVKRDSFVCPGLIEGATRRRGSPSGNGASRNRSSGPPCFSKETNYLLRDCVSPYPSSPSVFLAYSRRGVHAIPSAIRRVQSGSGGRLTPHRVMVNRATRPESSEFPGEAEDALGDGVGTADFFPKAVSHVENISRKGESTLNTESIVL